MHTKAKFGEQYQFEATGDELGVSEWFRKFLEAVLGRPLPCKPAPRPLLYGADGEPLTTTT